MPLCVRLQQQAQCNNWDVGSVSGQYGSAAPRCELYALLLALVLVPSPRWPAPLSCAVCVFSQGRRDRNITVSDQYFNSIIYYVYICLYCWNPVSLVSIFLFFTSTLSLLSCLDLIRFLHSVLRH